ncbi:MAG: cell division protein FtsZ [Candidatus Edwardsbacteria bacterium]
MFQFEEELTPQAKIKVIGVGGAGGNAVNRMMEAGLSGVEFIATNTDLQVLSKSKAPQRIQIGTKSTRGLGTGGDPKIGRQAIEEDKDKIAEAIQDTDMLFITAGMGGGTGTGAAPIIAELAREKKILTVAIVTKPFEFEGRHRMRQAEEGLAELKERVDTLISISNQKLFAVAGKQCSILEAFKMADEILFRATRSISDLIIVPGLINLDFADVRSVMLERGDAWMGTGIASGENRATAAAQEAISSPLLDDISINGAKSILINVTGGRELGLHEAGEAAGVVENAAGDEANIIFGAVIDEALTDEMRVTVIATGLGTPQNVKEEIPQVQEKTIDFKLYREDLTRPTFKRKEKASLNYIVEKGKIKTFNPDDLEVPTFMRKQMD